MEQQSPGISEEQEQTELPEDAAWLYSWASLEAFRYSDFPGSRREYRARLRRMEVPLCSSMEEDQESGESGAPGGPSIGQYVASQTEMGTQPKSENNNRSPEDVPADQQKSSAEPEERARPDAERASEDMLPKRYPQMRPMRRPAILPHMDRAAEARLTERDQAGRPAREDGDGYSAREFSASGVRPKIRYSYEPDPAETLDAVDQFARLTQRSGRRDRAQGSRGVADAPGFHGSEGQHASLAEIEPQSAIQEESAAERVEVSAGEAPAISAQRESAGPVLAQVDQPFEPAPDPRSRQQEVQENERASSKAGWFALQKVFEPDPRTEAASTVGQKNDLRGEAQIVALFSLAGGVGKTTMVATLGRTLAGRGKKVTLVDLTSRNLLSFYFGGTDTRRELLRTFIPPPGVPSEPVYLLSPEPIEARDENGHPQLLSEILRQSEGMDYVLVDLDSGDEALATALVAQGANIVVPVVPDINSVTSLRSLDRMFRSTETVWGVQEKPTYILNRFDESRQLHQEVRELLARTLRHRLLPIEIREAAAISDALADGMTVLDYDPAADVSLDYAGLADWMTTELAGHRREEPQASRSMWTEA